MATEMTDLLIPVVRQEFREMPGLRLTPAQFRRMWSLDQNTCDALLDALVASEFLQRTSDGAYRRRDEIGR